MTSRPRVEQHIGIRREGLEALDSVRRIQVEGDAALSEVVVPEVKASFRPTTVSMKGTIGTSSLPARRFYLHHIRANAGQNLPAVLAELVGDFEDADAR